MALVCLIAVYRARNYWPCKKNKFGYNELKNVSTFLLKTALKI